MNEFNVTDFINTLLVKDGQSYTSGNLIDCPIQIGLPGILNFALSGLGWLAGIGFFIGINYAIYLYVTSGGVEANIVKAKTVIRTVIVGALVVLLANVTIQVVVNNLTNYDQPLITTDSSDTNSAGKLNLTANLIDSSGNNFTDKTNPACNLPGNDAVDSQKGDIVK